MSSLTQAALAAGLLVLSAGCAKSGGGGGSADPAPAAAPGIPPGPTLSDVSVTTQASHGVTCALVTGVSTVRTYCWGTEATLGLTAAQPTVMASGHLTQLQVGNHSVCLEAQVSRLADDYVQHGSQPDYRPASGLQVLCYGGPSLQVGTNVGGVMALAQATAQELSPGLSLTLTPVTDAYDYSWAEMNRQQIVFDGTGQRTDTVLACQTDGADVTCPGNLTLTGASL